MLWFFDRDNEKVEVETRFDNNTLDYVLVIRWPGRPRRDGTLRRLRKLQRAGHCAL